MIMRTVDTCIKNGQVLNVFKRQFEQHDLWLDHETIVAVGTTDFAARKIIDARDKYIVPGFIDAHVHIESSMVTPSEVGKVLLKHGVTAIVTDPHEIANVMGKAGIEYMIKDARQTPMDIFFMLPSSVPCTPFEHAGAILKAADLKPLYQYPEVHGLAEVMDYPSVLAKDPETLAKIQDANNAGYHADGHAAGLSVEQLDVYRQAGIHTDHEAGNVAEINDRLATGFSIFLREGTVERDIANTIQAVNESNAQDFSFCTDDKLIDDLMSEGSIDYCIKLAIQLGIRPELAYTMASYNAAMAHNLAHTGALASGYQADLVFLNDPHNVKIDAVMKNGQWIKEQTSHPAAIGVNTVHHQLQLQDLALPLSSDYCHVIGIQPNHIVTDHIKTHVPTENGQFQADLNNDILKMAVIERHHHLGTVGLGLVKGFELQHGAIATTIAHDSHNLVVVGTSDTAMFRAVEEVTQAGGGITVVDDEKVLATMPLAIAGLMSAKDYQSAAQDLTAITAAYQQISTNREFNPFITLSFLTLPVIPSIKLTDQGLYDFDQQRFIDLEV